MPELDKLIEKMTQRNVQRVVMANDQAMRLFAAGREAPGPAVSMQQLEQIVKEVAPPPSLMQLENQGQCQFPYPSSHGIFNVTAQRSNGGLQVTIAPSPASQRVEANLPIGLGISTTAPKPPASLSPQALRQQNKSKGYLPAIGIGAVLLVLFIVFAVTAKSKLAQTAGVASELKSYKAAVDSVLPIV